MEIRAARLAADMSQDHLAKASGTSRRTIVRIEAGQPVSGETMRCVRAALDVPAAPMDIGPAGPPGFVVMAWFDGPPAEALRYAAMYAFKQMGPWDALYVGAYPFRDGSLWEMHEGGDGRGHLAGAAEALDADGGWVRSGRRILTVSMADGRPLCIINALSRPPDVSRMRALVPGGPPLRMIRAPFDPFRPDAPREVYGTCECGAPDLRSRGARMSVG